MNSRRQEGLYGQNATPASEPGQMPRGLLHFFRLLTGGTLVSSDFLRFPAIWEPIPLNNRCASSLSDPEQISSALRPAAPALMRTLAGAAEYYWRSDCSHFGPTISRGKPSHT